MSDHGIGTVVLGVIGLGLAGFAVWADTKDKDGSGWQYSPSYFWFQRAPMRGMQHD